jgi:predicted short-subunit dehydrogenase-like oxidoreductase (DUF2520 family)
LSVSKAKTKRQRPSVSIIGPGRLGQALAIALRLSGYPILALVARRPSEARKAVRTFNRSGEAALTLGLHQLAQLPATDLVLITTPDDAIAQTAQRLAAAATAKAGRRTVMHTSGALASDVLRPLAKSGFHTGSLHPLVSVSEPGSGAKALRGAFYCLEGDKTALRMARLIVKDLEGKSFSIRPENKTLYHAAAVMASPHLVALFDLATEMLAACGISKKSARQVLLPLVESTVNNLRVMNPEQALTGTFARGDVATVRRHIDALSGKELAEALEVYKLLGLHSVQLARKNGLDAELLERIRKALESANVRKKLFLKETKLEAK